MLLCLSLTKRKKVTEAALDNHRHDWSSTVLEIVSTAGKLRRASVAEVSRMEDSRSYTHETCVDASGPKQTIPTPQGSIILVLP